jgi:hypothetical protein
MRKNRVIVVVVLLVRSSDKIRTSKQAKFAAEIKNLQEST